MITVETILIFSSGGALGYLLRVLIEHSLAKSRDLQNRHTTAFNQAATEFYEAFTKELTALDPNGPLSGVDPYKILESALQRHKEAIIKFKRHLSADEAGRLDLAWQQYYRHHKHTDTENVCIEQYSADCCGLTERREIRKRAHDRLSDIVAFSKIK